MAWRSRSVRWGGIAAVVAIVVLGGFSWRTHKPGQGAPAGEWWLGPSTVWAAEIDNALSTAVVKGVAWWDHTWIVNADGSEVPSSTSVRRYVSRDSYRNDLYDSEVLCEIQWYTPDGSDMIQTSVCYDTKSYSSERHGGSVGQHDPIERLRFYSQLAGKADRLLGTKQIGDCQCVGFEIRASQYGDNPDTWIDRIWFDVQTKLPVMIEKVGRPVTGDPKRTFRSVSDRFDYASDYPADAFVPKIPSGFVNAPRDEVLKAQ